VATSCWCTTGSRSLSRGWVADGLGVRAGLTRLWGCSRRGVRHICGDSIVFQYAEQRAPTGPILDRPPTRHCSLRRLLRMAWARAASRLLRRPRTSPVRRSGSPGVGSLAVQTSFSETEQVFQLPRVAGTLKLGGRRHLDPCRLKGSSPWCGSLCSTTAPRGVSCRVRVESV